MKKKSSPSNDHDQDAEKMENKPWKNEDILISVNADNDHDAGQEAYEDDDKYDSKQHIRLIEVDHKLFITNLAHIDKDEKNDKSQAQYKIHPCKYCPNTSHNSVLNTFHISTHHQVPSITSMSANNTRSGHAAWFYPIIVSPTPFQPCYHNRHLIYH